MREDFNPWHNVSAGDNIPNEVIGIIEIPKGTRAKYELDKESGLLKLDRVLYSSVYYPANYGFIPQTYCDDKDPLDILILSQIDIVPMCIVPAKIIGVMRMLDNGEADDKIIAVAVGDPSVSHINDISELPNDLGGLKSLTVFTCTNNHLSEIPKAIGELSKLYRLDVSSNKLEFLPETLTNCSNLVTLCASYNKLKSLPKQIGNLKRLSWLYFDKNQVENFPKTFVELSGLHYLGLSDNKVKVLPEDFSKLLHLGGFSMNNNQLVVVPDSFFEMNSLIDIHLEKNNLNASTKRKLKKKFKSVPLYL